METKTYVKKDGSQGESYWLEKDDKIILGAEKPYRKDWGNGIVKHSIRCVNDKGEDFYLSLTKGQYDALNKIAEKGSLLGKFLVGTTYTNTFGTFVGVKVE